MCRQVNKWPVAQAPTQRLVRVFVVVGRAGLVVVKQLGVDGRGWWQWVVVVLVVVTVVEVRTKHNAQVSGHSRARMQLIKKG